MMTVNYNGKSYDADKYMSVGEFLAANDPEAVKSHVYAENPVVAALADFELLPLSARKNHSFTLKPVRLFSSLGTTMYRDSISFLMACASAAVYPKKRLLIGHSLGDGFYYTYNCEMEDDLETIARKLTAKMREIAAADLEIERRFLSYRDAVEYFGRMGFADTVSFLEYSNSPDVECYRIGNYYDFSSGVLLPYTGMLTLWEIRAYGDGLLLRYPRTANLLKLRPFCDNPKLFSVFREYKIWGEILGVTSVGELNRKCYDGGIFDYIRLSEALQARKIASIADTVKAKKASIVLVAGPSSSGKTTFANKLCLELKMLGLSAKRMSLDDYYLPPDEIPADENGNRDFEALEALKLDLLRSNLLDLSEGRAVHLPIYSFRTHKRTFEKEETVLKENSVLVIEGIHGLNPKLCPDLNPDKVFKIYISALTQINLDDHTRLSTTDSRLLRRIVRDYRSRNTECIATLRMWPGVLRGENRHIFPNQNNADVMINSSLDYEIGVLARYAVPQLKTVKPSEEEYYTTARRLLKLLDNVYPIPSEYVPRNSLLREFIGGGEFE